MPYFPASLKIMTFDFLIFIVNMIWHLQKKHLITFAQNTLAFNKCITQINFFWFANTWQLTRDYHVYHMTNVSHTHANLQLTSFDPCSRDSWHVFVTLSHDNCWTDERTVTGDLSRDILPQVADQLLHSDISHWVYGHSPEMENQWV